MALKWGRLVWGVRGLFGACLVGLIIIGTYRISDSCAVDWSPHFFVPYSPGEKDLLERMTAIKMDAQYNAHDDKDDSYLRIYDETYAQDFNPAIRRDISRS